MRCRPGSVPNAEFVTIPHQRCTTSCCIATGEPPKSAGAPWSLAPPINAGDQEQPHHVDEVPIPGSELEAEMLRRRELSGQGAEQADDQKDRADDDMRAVEAGRHEERRTVKTTREVECRVGIFPGLHAGEAQAE